MALEINRQTLEAEKRIGARTAQALVRAETLVPGAGRDAIEPLLADANLFISRVDVQADRVVIEGQVSCQAVYRQGEEPALRALTAQAPLNQALDIPGAAPGMLCRVRGGVGHVDARYENGHMVFMVSCDVTARVLALEPAEVIAGLSGAEGLQTAFSDVESVKLAAEADEAALLREEVALPAALDARTALMDWAAVEIDGVTPDLGGVRVKGRVLVETLVSSGVPGRPGVLVRYPMALDQLVELPEWLMGNVAAEADVQSVRSAIEPRAEDGDMRLSCEAQLRVRVLANATHRASALTDAYATRGASLSLQAQPLEVCASAARVHTSDVVRGTVLLGENAPGVGIVIAAQARPVIGEWRQENGQGCVEGVIETRVLYMPAGSELPAAAEAELPFALTVPQPLDEDSDIDLQVLSCEANALMSDRLEMKLQLSLTCETRTRRRLNAVQELQEGEPIQRRPGIILAWPDSSDTAWEIARRYAVPADTIEAVEAGKAVVIRV